MTQPLNGPIEVGIRTLIMLSANFPAALDLNRLVLFDYILLHSADLEGPESIHPAIPKRQGELGLKRFLIERSLQVPVRAQLVKIEATAEGLVYSATEEAEGFLASLTSGYAAKLSETARWVSETFGSIEDVDVKTQLRSIFDEWAEEFDSDGMSEP
jgi:hypothetical protein